MIVVSFGGGSNSAAVLIGQYERGIRPDLILMADTGNEKPQTYAFIETMQAWLKSVGFPAITMVKNNLPQGIKDGSLYNECLRLGTMPSKVFGYSSCSVKWKVDPQIKYIRQWMTERGIAHVIQVVGYDADEIHRSEKKVASVDWKTNYFPLIEWGWGRDECLAAIQRSGLPQPGKSACHMCPSSKKHEVVWLKENHPELYAMDIELERKALAGEGQAGIARVIGLGRYFNWQTFAGNDSATPEVDCGCYDGE